MQDLGTCHILSHKLSVASGKLAFVMQCIHSAIGPVLARSSLLLLPGLLRFGVASSSTDVFFRCLRFRFSGSRVRRKSKAVHHVVDLGGHAIGR